MEADNDDFQDLDEPLYRLNDENDLYVHLEDVLPAGETLSFNSGLMYNKSISCP